MSITKVISSPQNPLIKNIILLLEKARERRKQGLFVAEGLIEVGMALGANYQIEHLLYDPNITSQSELKPLLSLQPNLIEKCIEVNAILMEKIAYRAGVPNVVGVFKTPEHRLEEIILNKNPLVLVLEAVEKPGNLGAMLRTADAVGVDAVILCDPQTDWYNPNVIRASLGAVFDVAICQGTALQVMEWLKKHQIEILATHLEASYPYYNCDMTKPSAIIMGTEADGISNFWIDAAHQKIIIPMYGKVDSMNVSVSAAVLLFEALRQRNNK
jgi:TrmH family RNA methyltransferase